MNPEADNNPDPVPTDARQATPEQREVEEQLEQQDGDPDAPGAQQSAENTADESRR